MCKVVCPRIHARALSLGTRLKGGEEETLLMARMPLLPSLPSPILRPRSLSLFFSLFPSTQTVNDIKQTFNKDTDIHVQTDNCDTYILFLVMHYLRLSVRERERERTGECGVCGITGVHAYIRICACHSCCVCARERVCVRACERSSHEHLLSTRHTDGQGCPIYRFLPEVWKLNYDLNYKN